MDAGKAGQTIQQKRVFRGTINEGPHPVAVRVAFRVGFGGADPPHPHRFLGQIHFRQNGPGVAGDALVVGKVRAAVTGEQFVEDDPH